MPKKIIAFAIKLCVTVGLFTLLFRPQTFGLDADTFGGVTPAKMLAEISEVEVHNIAVWLVFALAVKLSGMLAGVLRWRLLLQGQGLRIPFWYLVQSWFIGRAIGIFLPGTIGLDGYRLFDSALYTREPIKATTVIAIEKLIGFISLTFLVFLTFPLGFRLLNIKLPVLAAILFVLAGFVAVSFLLLLNPRVIQVIFAVVPAPAAIRSKVDKIGAAITAYGGSRRSLLLAVVFGLMVHAGTCFMYFGTMMAIRAANTNLLDILFASPLMIYGTVLGPSIGGEGIREIVFVYLLSGKSGAASAATFAHLGWWVGEFVPFVIGAIIFLLRTRPGKEQMQSELAKARAQSAEATHGIHLTPEETAGYRNRLIACLVSGIFGGLIAGALVGLGEAAWLARTLHGLTELGAFWWGPLVYGMLFLFVGLGIAGALTFLYLLFDRFARPAITFGLTLGGAAGAGALAISLFRFKRDVLAGHNPTIAQVAAIAGAALGVALLLALVSGVIVSVVNGRRETGGRRKLGIAMGVAVYVLLVIVGIAVSSSAAPGAPSTAFNPPQKAAGPNIILLAMDALRADYLPLFSNEAVAKTPNLDAFAQDAVKFQNAFAQASWTKPSFATLFSGRYPESHTATTKTSSLPEDVTTFPELLHAAGYYTKGFSNNPNITSVFGFNQGFVDYEDLKPNPVLGAPASATKLSLYEAIRKGWQKVKGKLPFMGGMVVTDFYQPAETVTGVGLEWLDSGQRPKDAPFFLFLHYMDPHDPFMDWQQPGVGYARARMENPDPEKFLEPMKKAYNSEIEHLDEHLGALFAGLRERGLYDNTLIVFVADHGEEFFDHKGWWHGQSLFDELIRIPLLVKLPGNSLAGQVNEDFARHIDVAPTILTFGGAEKDAAMPGKPLLTADGAFPIADTGYVYAENDFENNIMQAVRTKTRKVIRANEGNPRNHAPIELYDMENDPKEQTNIAGQEPFKLDEGTLLKTLDDMQAHIKQNAAEPSLTETAPGELKEQLESLGYLE